MKTDVQGFLERLQQAHEAKDSYYWHRFIVEEIEPLLAAHNEVERLKELAKDLQEEIENLELELKDEIEG